MTPKEKAEELIDKFKPTCNGYLKPYESGKAIQCAIICAEDILPLLDDDLNADNMYKSADYWNEVLTLLKAMQ